MLRPLAAVGALVSSLALLGSAAPAALAAPEAGAPISRVVLTPIGDPATSTAVSFRSIGEHGEVDVRVPGGPVVRHAAAPVLSRPGGPAAPLLPPPVMPVSAGDHWSVHLRGLVPDTTYEYRPVVDGRTGQWQRFTTAKQGAAPFEFVWYGDAQNSLDDVWPKVAGAARDAVPGAALTVHSGDQINNADRDHEWGQYFAGMRGQAERRPVIAALGNHEWMADPTYQNHRAHFEYPLGGPAGQPETNYVIDYQGVRFVTLHANYMGLVEQSMWLDRVLADNPHDWAIVNFHMPIWSATIERDDPVHNLAFRHVLEAHDVDLVLTGHDHAYARGHSAGRADGPVYAVSVAGGKYYPVVEGGNPWGQWGGQRDVAFGGISTFQHIEVDGCRLDYRAIVGHVSDEATRAAAEGDVIDRFSIDKCGGAKRVR